ncbi:MAG: DUF1801 domain-containing protein [Bacteroidota bacterium]
MGALRVSSDAEVAAKFQAYPDFVKPQLLYLRSLIEQVAKESETIQQMEETLKWGEPSYLVKKGSTIRMDWKARKPEQYAMYFSCSSLLVPTFKMIFTERFQYEKNRAIIFTLQETVPEQELKLCIHMALHYHSIKHLPLLRY